MSEGEAAADPVVAEGQPVVEGEAQPVLTQDTQVKAKTKTVLVRKVVPTNTHAVPPRQIHNGTSKEKEEALGKSRVIVAHKLKAEDATSTAAAVSTVLSPVAAGGPAKDAKGNVLAHTVLGPVSDYVEMKRQVSRQARLTRQANMGGPSTPRSANASNHSSRSNLSSARKAEEEELDDEQVIARRKALRQQDIAKGKEMEKARFNSTLSRLLPENKLLQTRDERSFKKFQAVQAEWENFQKRMAAKLGKPVDKVRARVGMVAAHMSLSCICRGGFCVFSRSPLHGLWCIGKLCWICRHSW
jgi:hypothetical protein